MSNIVECNFTTNYKNFGSQPDHLNLIKGCKVVVLNIFNTCLDDYSRQYLRFKKDDASKAYESLLGFLLKTFTNQESPESSIEDKSKPKYVFLTEDLVPPSNPRKPWSKSNIPKVIGHRIFVFYRTLTEGVKLCSYLKEYINFNAWKHIDSNFEDARPGELNHKLMMTTDAYFKWAGFIVSANFSSDRDNLLPTLFTREDNVASIESILSIKKGMMEQCTIIDPLQTKLSEYQVMSRNAEGKVEYNYKFPYTIRMRRYTPNQLDQFMVLEIPGAEEESDIASDTKDNVNYDRMIQELMNIGYARKNPDTGHDEFDSVKYSAYRNTLSSEELKYAYDANETGINEMLGATMSSSSDRYNKKSHKYWFDRHSQERCDIMEQWRMECEKPANKLKKESEKQDLLSLAMNSFWEKCAAHFAYIWSKVNEEQSPYKKHCIEWSEQYQQSHKGKFFLKFNKTSSNLSLWEDFLCNIMSDLETVYKVSTVHDKVLIMWLSTLNASDPNRKQKFNILNWGAAAQSKSYATDIAEEWSIPGLCILG
jgi:hypothetical protein